MKEPRFGTHLNVLAIGLALALMLTIGQGERADGQSEDQPLTENRLAEALKEHTKELMSYPGVVGTALGACDGRPCIKVYVVKRTADLDRKILDRLNGYPVEIEESGEIKALPEDPD
ncbi:MAG TPA: hypothetical protein VFA47_00475 [Candidatus Manganitrophaceae bacterium]|nr:hypothetical protein [Candidatus Manganitrophaceae bacterium]